MTKVYLEYRSQGDYQIYSVHLSGGMRDQFLTDEEINVGDIVYVTYVAYDSGDTFGTSSGYGFIFDVTKDAQKAGEGARWANDIVAFHENEKLSRYRAVSHPMIEPERPDWVSPHAEYSFCGYFDSNQIVRLQQFVVQE